jgi:hypothetical protein
MGQDLGPQDNQHDCHPYQEQEISGAPPGGLGEIITRPEDDKHEYRIKQKDSNDDDFHNWVTGKYRTDKDY